jgi:hypothetical protein
MSYSLRAFSPVVVDSTPKFAADLGLAAKGWRRSIRSLGGYWQGRFMLEGSIDELSGLFYNWLEFHLVEQVRGVTTWEGMIYEMELAHGGVKRRRSLDLMANRVRVDYRDVNNEDQETAWASQAQSVARYGQKEEIERLDSMTAPGAEAMRDRLLGELAWPWARPVSVHKTAQTTLSVVACGYAFTANWRYCTQTSEYDSEQGTLTYAATTFTDSGQSWTAWATTSGDAVYSVWVVNSDNTLTWAYLGSTVSGTQINVYQDQARTTGGWNGAGITDKAAAAYYVRGPAYDLITDVVGTDCEYLSLGKADANLVQVNRVLSNDTRAWDVMRAAVELGDTDGDPWRLYVQSGRKVVYEEIDTTPRYYLRGGSVYDSVGAQVAVSPWLVQPAVVRDMAFTVARAELGSWLDDARDIYVDEVEVDADGQLTLKTGLFSEGEILAEQASYVSRLPKPAIPEGEG